MNRAGLLLMKPRCFVEQECTDEVIAMNSAATALVTPAMATTGSFFNLMSIYLRMFSAQALCACREGKPLPTFPDHAAGNKKAPAFSGGASVQMMRSSAYARTSPEALAGFADFAVRLVLVIVARAYAGDFDWRQRVSPQNWASTRLNRMP
jgi:hypothetical protein